MLGSEPSQRYHRIVIINADDAFLTKVLVSIACTPGYHQTQVNAGRPKPLLPITHNLVAKDGKVRVRLWYRATSTKTSVACWFDRFLFIILGSCASFVCVKNLLGPQKVVHLAMAVLCPVLQEHARDSFENLLFSLCRFFELTGHFPDDLLVIGYEFKHERFSDLHRAALRWPDQRFSFVGTPALTAGAQEVIDASERGVEL